MMTTLAQPYSSVMVQIRLGRKIDDAIEKLIPRRCMVISVGLFLAGLSVPALMVFGLLTVNLLTAAIGLALTALGGVLSLTLCGEI
jgi:type IV secretory pathway TrbL component